MIQLIQIQNFQAYLYTELELSPGVNAIIGGSDKGKSTIIRLLNWVFNNNPKGFSFKNKDCKDTEETFGCVVFDDESLVVRVRDNKKNCYVLEDESILQALRTDVPQEIKEITRIKPVNIQTQHPSDQYFLLGEKPGAVAKEFNKVSNLEIMDNVLKITNGRIRKVSSRIDFIDEELESDEKKLESFAWLDDALKKSEELQKQNNAIDDKLREYDWLEEQISHHDKLVQQIEKFQALEECERELQGLIDSEEKVEEKNKRFLEIDGLVFSLEEAISKLSAYADIDQCAKAFYTLEKTSGALQEKIKAAAVLRNLITQHSELIKSLNYSEKELKILEKKFHDELGKDLCPLCGSKIQ